MSLIHNLLDVFAFSVGVIETTHVYIEGKKTSRRWALPVLVGLLVLFGGCVVFEWVDHHSERSNTEAMIIELAKITPRTFDELSRSVPLWDLPLLSEALDDLVRSKRVVYDDVTLSQADGSIQHQLRLYRADLTVLSQKEK